MSGTIPLIHLYLFSTLTETFLTVTYLTIYLGVAGDRAGGTMARLPVGLSRCPTQAGLVLKLPDYLWGPTSIVLD